MGCVECTFTRWQRLQGDGPFESFQDIDKQDISSFSVTLQSAPSETLSVYIRCASAEFAQSPRARRMKGTSSLGRLLTAVIEQPLPEGPLS
jgi:hypothetical protein